MVDAPKRSVGETITQLVVIAILIAILIGAIIIFRQYVESHNSSNSISTKPTFTFTCCAGFNSNVVYHPGDMVRVAWTPVEDSPGDYPKGIVTLSASLSDSFTSVQLIKSSAISDPSISKGPFIATDRLRVSNRSGISPITSFRIPNDARPGYYDLVTTVSQTDLSTSGASIFVIRRHS
ncbi:MAG TPA: hypothetical protein VMU68_03735 [Acidimicrobiales bacterium]|nr:hypothetical protein [Acidimicrobiales bacterium]